MAIYKMVGDKEKLDEVEPTSFGQEGILERADLQRILRDQPEVLDEGILIISEEFGNWQDSNRRIDLLGLDASGRLVVIELKRGETGEHMDLQAIRYAAMVANMTFQQAIDNYQAYLDKRANEEGNTVEADAAETLIREHLGIREQDNQAIQTDIPRIILASENFGKELTTCVLWLNDSWLRNEKLDIKCVRLQLHRNGDQILLETSVVVPLPEASDYQTQLAQRKQEERVHDTIVMDAGRPQYFEGADEFYKGIAKSPEQFQEGLRRLHEDAISLQAENLADLHTFVTGGHIRLELRLPGKDEFLASFNNLLFSKAEGEITFWPGWEDVAPKARRQLDEIIGTVTSKSNLQHRKLTTKKTYDSLPSILSAIRGAYREAKGTMSPETGQAPEG